jgi:hypothetical protein
MADIGIHSFFRCCCVHFCRQFLFWINLGMDVGCGQHPHVFLAAMTLFIAAIFIIKEESKIESAYI